MLGWPLVFGSASAPASGGGVNSLAIARPVFFAKPVEDLVLLELDEASGGLFPRLGKVVVVVELVRDQHVLFVLLLRDSPALVAGELRGRERVAFDEVGCVFGGPRIHLDARVGFSCRLDSVNLGWACW